MSGRGDPRNGSPPGFRQTWAHVGERQSRRRFARPAPPLPDHRGAAPRGAPSGRLRAPAGDWRPARRQRPIDREGWRGRRDARNAARVLARARDRGGLGRDLRRRRVLHDHEATPQRPVRVTGRRRHARGRAACAPDRITAENLEELRRTVRSGDVVLVHDPQPAGLVAPLVELGARVVWWCHVGYDGSNEWTDRAWEFVRPYVEV